MTYSHNSENFRESTKKKTVEEAEQVLNQKKEELAGLLRTDRHFTIHDMFNLFKINQKEKHNKSIDQVTKWAEELENYFTQRHYPRLNFAFQITPDEIRSYKEWFAKEFKKRNENRGKGRTEPASGTINRRLSVLKRAIRLSYKERKINRIEEVPMDRELNIRQGYIEDWMYLDLMKALEDCGYDYLVPVFATIYWAGWRKNEILSLTWNDVSLGEGFISLPKERSKNNKSRETYLPEEVLEMLRELRLEAIEKRSKNSEKRYKDPEGNQLVFLNPKGGKITNYLRHWQKACDSIELYNTADKNRKYYTFHDCRRSTCKRMIEHGVSEKVVCLAMGWTSGSKMVERYQIVRSEDLKMAAIKVATAVKRERETR
jgi:integrase